MNHNFLLRVISGLILFPLFLVSIVWLSSLFYLLVALVAVLIFAEWWNMTKHTHYFKYGFLIIPLPIICIVLLKHDYGYKITLLYLFSICSVDIFAMFGGKLIGGIKLAPVLSPNKTWSGLLCGCVASSLVCFLVGKFLAINDFPINLALYGFINGFVSQASDIFISYFKRKCNVRDTGNIIPGHGGMLDRADSTIFSAPFLLLLVSFF
jgi:phosphatidate cytidylyltransferase